MSDKLPHDLHIQILKHLPLIPFSNSVKFANLELPPHNPSFHACSHPNQQTHISNYQVCYNGIIHWVACDKGNDLNEVWFCSLILSFDLITELFVEMLLPDALACQNVLNLSISERKGCLAMMEYDLEKGMESSGVWVMREYGVIVSWERMYVIRLPGLLRRSVGFRMNGDVVLALKNNELVFVDCDGNVKSLGIYTVVLPWNVHGILNVDQSDGWTDVL